MSGAEGDGNQQDGSAGVWRAGVFGAASAAAGAGRAAIAGKAAGFSGDRIVRAASDGGEAGFFVDDAERRRDRADLPAAGRTSAGDRTGGGASESTSSGGIAGAAGEQPGTAHGGSAGSAGATADAAPRDRLESRIADAVRADALPEASGFCGRLDARSGRSGVQRERGFGRGSAGHDHVAGG